MTEGSPAPLVMLLFVQLFVGGPASAIEEAAAHGLPGQQTLDSPPRLPARKRQQQRQRQDKLADAGLAAATAAAANVLLGLACPEHLQTPAPHPGTPQESRHPPALRKSAAPPAVPEVTTGHCQ